MLTQALKTLGVPRGSSIEEIRKAYLKLVRRYPPEHFEDKFREIQFAYDQLSTFGESQRAIIGRIIDSETIMELGYEVFGDMVDDTVEGPGLSSLYDICDSAFAMSPEEFMAALKIGPINYRRGFDIP